MFKSPLVPVDGSEPSLAAARLAGLFAPGGTLTLLHAVRPGPVYAAAGLDAVVSIMTGAPNAASDQVATAESVETNALFEQARQRLGESVQVESRQVEGRPSDEILEALESGAHDSIFLGSRGRGPLTRALLGSVSDTVLRHASTPVLIARGEKISKLLVAVDGSPPSLRAARIAAEFARASGARVVLLHVVETDRELSVESQQTLAESLQAASRLHTADARAALAGLPVDEEIVVDDPARAIQRTAERTGAELVVLGRRGVHPSRFSTLGSVSLRVALNASQSVLVVP